MAKSKKIVEASSFELIKEISIDEAGFGERLKNLVTGKDRFKPSKEATRADAETLASASHEVLTSIFQIPTGEKRLIVYLSDADVNNLYRKAGGAKLLVNALGDDKSKQKSITSAFPSLGFVAPTDIDGKHIAHLLGDTFTMSMLDKSFGKNAVLLNIENSIADYFSGTKKPASLKEAMKILADAIDHKNFMAVVNASGGGVLSPSLQDSDDIDELLPEFNFEKIVKAFTPVASLQAAKEEWKEAEAARNKATDDEWADDTAKKVADEDEFENKVLTTGKAKLAKFVREYIMNTLKGKFPKTSAERSNFVNGVTAQAKDIIDGFAGGDTGDKYEHLADELIAHVIESSNRRDDMVKLFSGETAVAAKPRTPKSEKLPDVAPTSTEVKAAKNILKSFKGVSPEGLIRAISDLSKSNP